MKMHARDDYLRNHLIALAAAIGVCASIAVFHQPAVGVVGVIACIVVIGLRLLVRQRADTQQHGSSDLATQDSRVVGDSSKCYNVDNPTVPVYYPTEQDR